ncbi:hypothetical protein D3C77_628400 [compost metagenome]
MLAGIAYDGVVLQAPEVETTGDVQIDAGLHRLGFPTPGPQIDPGPGGWIGVAASGIAEHFIIFVAIAVKRQLGFPALGEVVLEGGESGREVAVGVGPTGGRRIRAGPFGPRAVAVE